MEEILKGILKGFSHRTRLALMVLVIILFYITDIAEAIKIIAS